MTTENVRLVDGKIPANTACPYRVDCPSAQSFTCGHKGGDHPVPFSCGYARLFEIYNRG